MEADSTLGGYSYTVSLLGFICSCFSIIGALFTIFSYAWIPNLRKNFFFYLVFHLAISDLGVALTGLILVPPSEIDSSLCTTMATIRCFSIMSSFILNLSIALFLYRAIRYGKSQEELFREKNSLLYLNYGFSIFGSIGPLITNSYGPSSISCWIDVSTTNIVAQFWLIVEAYITLPLVLIWVIVLYYWIIKMIKSTADPEQYSDIYKLAIIPLIFFFCNGGTLLDYFFKSNTIIKIGHTCLRQSQGIIHALIYGFILIKDEIKKKLNERNESSRQLQEKILEG